MYTTRLGQLFYQISLSYLFIFLIRLVFVYMRSTILPSGGAAQRVTHRYFFKIFLYRDDPSLDESTRLRNRIAELESLVRELRGTITHLLSVPFHPHLLSIGKPHPRWAESSFRDGDPNEKWHSRATKCVPLPKRNGQQPQQPQQTTQSQQQLPDDMLRNGRAVPSLLSPIKTEPTPEANAQLYRFSPSPAPSMRYHTFQADVRSDSSSSFDNDPRPGYNPSNGSGMYPTNTTHYTTSGTGSTAPSTYSDGGGGVSYPLSNSDDGSTSYGDHFSVNNSPQSHFLCPCRSNPALGITYLQLSQTLQQSLNSMRQYNHPTNSHCALFRRIVELSNALQ